MLCKAPHHTCAAVHHLLEQVCRYRRCGDVNVEKHGYRLFLLLRELPHLQVSRVGRRLPVHVTCALESDVWTDAVEIVPSSAEVRFDVASQIRQHDVE